MTLTLWPKIKGKRSLFELLVLGSIATGILAGCASSPKPPRAPEKIEKQTKRKVKGLESSKRVPKKSLKKFNKYVNALGWTMKSFSPKWKEAENQRTELGLPTKTLVYDGAEDFEVFLYDIDQSTMKFADSTVENMLEYLFKLELDTAMATGGEYKFYNYNSSIDSMHHWAEMWRSKDNLVFLYVKSHNPGQYYYSKKLPKFKISLWNPSNVKPAKLQTDIFNSHIYNFLGLKSVEEKRYTSAMRYFKKAYKRDSTYIPYWVNIAAIYHFQEQHIHGVQFFETKMDQVKSSAILSGTLGDFYENLKNYKEAQKWAEIAMELDPDNEDWLINLSDALWQQGKKVQAKNLLAEGFENRFSFKLGVVLADTYLGLEEFYQAKRILNLIDRTDVTTKKFMEYMMVAHNGLGDYSLTLNFFRKKVPRDSVTARMFVQKAMAEFHLRNYLIAEFTLKKAFKIDPTNDEAKRLQTRLKALVGIKTNSLIKKPLSPLISDLTPNRLLSKVKKQKDYKEVTLINRDVVFKWNPRKHWTKTTELIYYIPKGISMEGLPEITFELNANHTKLFVNQFEIFNVNFQKVKTGKIKDYYITKFHNNTVDPENLLVHIPIDMEKAPIYVVAHVTEQSIYGIDRFPFLSYTTKNSYPFEKNTFSILNPPPGITYQKFGDVKVDSSVYGLTFHIAPSALTKEKYAPSFEEYGSGFAVAHPADWKNTGKEYLRYIEGKGVFVDSLSLSVKEQLDDIKHGLPKGASQIQAVFKYVRDQIRYNNYEMSLHSLIPEQAQKVITKKSSDCKGHAFLLQQLLKALGVEAHLALINTELDAFTDLPSVHQFNHMLVHYYDSTAKKDYFLDPTEKYQAFRQVPLHLEGKNVLILDWNKSRLTTIPSIEVPSEHGMDIVHTFDVDKNGEVKGKDVLSLRGKFAADFRQQIRKLKKLGKEEVLISWIAEGYPGYWSGNLSIKNQNNLEEPLQIIFEYTLPFPVQTFKNGWRVPIQLEKSLFRYPSAEERKTPIYFPYQVDVSSKWTFNFPKSFKFKHNLRNSTKDAKHMRWTIRTDKKNRYNYLNFSQSWSLTPFLASAKSYRKIQRDWDEFFEYSDVKLTLTKK